MLWHRFPSQSVTSGSDPKVTGSDPGGGRRGAEKLRQGLFSACDRLLDRDGLMLLQTITVNDWRFRDYRSAPSWIAKYIFPGAERGENGEAGALAATR